MRGAVSASCRLRGVLLAAYGLRLPVTLFTGSIASPSSYHAAAAMAPRLSMATGAMPRSAIFMISDKIAFFALMGKSDASGVIRSRAIFYVAGD